MVNVAQAWAEEYMKKHPDVNIDVRGGGSGVGIASLIDGKCDLANASRKMTESEIQKAKANRGADPKELIVGYDALAIYVPKDNPLDSISIDELAEIYGKDGKINKWSEVGVKDPKLADQPITRVSRQSSSGTYAYFREVVVGEHRDYKLGLDRPERLEGRGGGGGPDALGHRLQRHGLQDPGSEDAQGLEASGRAGRGPHGGKRRGTTPIPSPAPCKSTSSVNPPERSKSISIGSSLPRARRWCWTWDTSP